MPRYFLEVAYKGARYSGFQVQENANSIQAEIENAFEIYFRKKIEMTGSSRTDSGVNALQNFFHFDFDGPLNPRILYNINSLLPNDIVARNLYQAGAEAHCRFDAISREYQYYIYKKKNPFIEDRAYYFPYSLDLEKLQEAAATLLKHTDFTSFSKRNTQVKNFHCRIITSEWRMEKDCWVYRVKSNRFLRGMVRGLVGTMLQHGRGKMSVADFEKVLQSQDCAKADFSVPGHGLFLVEVSYPEGFLVPMEA